MVIPLLGNHFVEGWNWSPGGFFRVAAMIFGLGVGYQAAARRRPSLAYRVALGITFATSFAILWSNFVQFVDVQRVVAMHLGVPLVVVVASAIARLRPQRMARAMAAVAGVQWGVLAAVLVIKLLERPNVVSWTWPELRGLCGNAVYGGAFAVSSFLFRYAAQAEQPAE
jgi:FtsH-binding integral membrane protein